MGISARPALLLVLLASGLARGDESPPPKKKKPPEYSSKVKADKAEALKTGSTSRTLITEQDIKNAQPKNAGDLLTRVAGLQVRQEDQSGFRLNLGVRGMSPVRSRLVLVEEDGVPVVVSPYGEPELYYITSVERIQSIDVIKGSDVLRYGPQTVGAVVQLHTWDPTPTPSWYTSATGGSYKFFETLGRYSDTTKSGIGYVAQAYYKRSDGVRAMAFQAADGMGKVRIPLSSSSELNLKAGFHWDHTDTTYTGLTDTQYEHDPRQNTVAPHDYQDTQRYELALTHDKRWSTGTTLHSAVFAYHMTLGFRLQEFTRGLNNTLLQDGEYVPGTAGDCDLCFQNTTSLRNRLYDVVGASTQLEQKFVTGFVKHKLTLGLRMMSDNARRQDSTGAMPTDTHGVLDTDDTTNIFGLGAFIEDQVALTDWLLVTPAFRVEYSHSTKTLHVIQPDTDTTPQSVHIVGSSQAWGPMPGVSVILGKATINAFTTLYEGYSAPRVAQAITPDGKDADLHAEHSTNWEIGLRGRWRNALSAEGDVFMINFDNQLVSNNPLSGSGSAEFVDGGRTQHIGAEATAKVRFGRALKLPLDIDLSGTYTYVHSRFVGGSIEGHSTNGKTIPYAPVNTAIAVLDVSHKIGISAQVAFTYIGAQYSDEENTVEPSGTGLTGLIPAYTTLDLGARYRNARTGIGVALTVKNVLDRVYISDRLPDGIFTAGFREILGTLSWSSGS